MRVSLTWIKRLLAVPRLTLGDEELAARLTLRTAEIEHGLTRVGAHLDGVVVGKVLTCVKHPQADRLRCTTVTIGTGPELKIVCGAPNVAAGQTVAVATVGTVISSTDAAGKTSTFTIKPAKLRGEPSEGMLCSCAELGLDSARVGGAGGVSGASDGILVLPDHLPAGQPLAQALGIADTVLSIENIAITHRPDLWGQWGWALEIAAACGLPAPAAPDVAWTPEPGPYRAEIRDAGCKAYLGAVVEGVDNRPSPAWLQDLLTACGVRPLGLLVDVTNFVMLELGEPMHAFDLRELSGTTVTVRGGDAGESITTLDGRTHALTPSDLVIADQSRALALAGIMGGQGSMIRADTSAVLLEAACFDGARIRRTRQRFGTATDSSARFEKSLYPELAVAGMNRCIALLREIIPTCRVTHRFHAGTLAAPVRRIALDPALAPRRIGLAISADEQARHLAALGFRSESGTVTVPWWRAKDVVQGMDLVEEIARSHGYDRLVPEAPRLIAEAPAANVLREHEHRARRALSALGWDEVATYAFTSPAWATALGWDAGQVIRLNHPMSAEQSILRLSLLPTLAEAVGRNRKHLDRVAIFEVGKRYGAGLGVVAGVSAGITPDECLVVAGACAAAGDEAPFFTARDAAAGLLRGLGFASPDADAPYVRALSGAGADAELSPGRAVELVVAPPGAGRAAAPVVVGVAGELPKALRNLAGCPERVGWFRVDLERLLAALGPAKPVVHHPPSRFPAVDRDFTWECSEGTSFVDLARPTRAAAGAICQRIDLVSVYRGAPYPADRKAVSLKVVLQSDDRTLTDAEIQAVHQRVIDRVTATGAVLRG